MRDLPVLIGFAVLGVLLVIALSRWTPDARLRRRRRKTHSRLTTTAHRPMVRFSVKAPRKKA